MGQQWNVQATPALFVTDAKGRRTQLENPSDYASVKRAIDSALAAGGAPATP